MKTFIRATGMSVGLLPVAGALAAARECVARPAAVEVLVSVGTYREDNSFEPSNASRIQQELGIHPEYLPGAPGRAVLSFDLSNGDCGLLTAVHVISSMFTTKGLNNALVVSADGHTAKGFPFAGAAAALLLESAPGQDAGPGFGPAHFVRQPGSALRGYLDLSQPSGRSRISVEQDSDRAARSLEMAHAAAREIPLDDDLKLIAPQCDEKQPYRLADRLGIPDKNVLTADAGGADPRTSTLAIAFHQARTTGRLAAGDRVLMVASDGGPCAASAIYTV